MIEKIFEMSLCGEKVVEKIIQDENIHYIHMIFNEGEGIPQHYSNSTVYMTVIRGTLSIGLNEQDISQYKKGTILKIPVDTKMDVKNLSEDILELIVVKSPAPIK